MKDFIYRTSCYIHHTIKKLLGREVLSVGKMFCNEHYNRGDAHSDNEELWRQFVENSRIIGGEFAGCHYAGYILEKEQWCLPSWIWTCAAIVRMYCAEGHVDKAIELGELLLSKQNDCGGWIVRCDYDSCGAIPMLAPNDSAYIANNALLSLYGVTKNEKYLNAARRCADWVIETSRPDGLVYLGFNARDGKWVKDCVIVDIGFTAGLFANLLKIRSEEKYFKFLQRFVDRYIELFYMPEEHGFCTSIDSENKKQGGMFGRGQAWALEGLIPAYSVLKSEQIRDIVDSTIEGLIHRQLKNGGWSYNFTKPYLGEDCKAVSVIAKNIFLWKDYFPVSSSVIGTVNAAMDWCRRHTILEGQCVGGIFSFCMEGAIVQELYTSCAFVYSSAYAVELSELLKNESNCFDM